MHYIALYFIMTNATGYSPPMEFRSTDSALVCGISGAIVGLQVNKLENPTIALWPDPHEVDKHCEADIASRVAESEVGEYHLATTEMGVSQGFGAPPEIYIGIDPHTSVYWIKSNNPMDVIPRVKNVRVQ